MTLHSLLNLCMILKMTADELSLNSRKSQVFLINTDGLGNGQWTWSDICQTRFPNRIRLYPATRIIVVTERGKNSSSFLATPLIKIVMSSIVRHDINKRQYTM